MTHRTILAAAAVTLGFVVPLGITSAQAGKDNVFPGRWLSSTAGEVASLLEGREGYCLGFSSAAVDLTGFDDDNDGLIDEDPFNGIDDDLDGLIDEDIAGFGSRARIYMTHGNTSLGDTDDVRAYDIQNDVWLDDSGVPPNLPPAAPASASIRAEGVGVDHGGLIYCLGGRFAGVLSLAEAYDPTTNGWTTLSSMPTARAGLAAAVVGSRIYTAGGRGVGGGPCSGSPLNVAEAYDIPSDTWTPIMPPPIPVTDAAAVDHGGKVFLIGGCTSGAAVTTAVQIYDRTTDTWMAGASMPTARASLALGVLGNTIYAIGGVDGTFLNLDVVEAYDIDKDSWTPMLATKPTPASEIWGVSHGGKIYVPGSGSFGLSLPIFEVLLKK